MKEQTNDAFMRISNDIPCRWRVTEIKDNHGFHTDHGERAASDLFSKVKRKEPDISCSDSVETITHHDGYDGSRASCTCYGGGGGNSWLGEGQRMPGFHTDHGERAASDLFFKKNDKNESYVPVGSFVIPLETKKSNVEKKVLQFLSALKNAETEDELRELIWALKYEDSVEEWLSEVDSNNTR